MDDLQRQPEGDDRDALAARIKRAHAEGRIGLADRDIRLGNVRSAQSMAELDLMRRELDQLDAALAPTSAATTEDTVVRPYGTFQPGAGSGGSGPVSVSGRTVIIVLVVVLALMVAVAGVVFVGFRDTGSSGSPARPAAPEPVIEAPAPPGEAQTEDAKPTPSGAKYALTGPGIRGFLQTYQKRFGTTRVVDLTMYGEYVIVNVPVPGKARQSGWLYREGAWTQFGGVRAVFPGSRIVDTRELAVPALMRNIARARASLNVEQPTQTYVILRFIATSEEVPSVDIHLANEFRESGYLATTLDGKVERAYPYAS